MPSVKVEVKWQKETFKDVEIDLEQPPSVFKLQLFSLTGVPPERQKVMGVKGGLLKDDADWAKLGLKPGQKLTMMGTAETLPEAPKQQQTFMEDLPEEEQDTTGTQGATLPLLALLTTVVEWAAGSQRWVDRLLCRVPPGIASKERLLFQQLRPRAVRPLVLGGGSSRIWSLIRAPAL